MPLEQGSSKEVISRNIAELVKAGHSRAQSAAIAYKEAGDASPYAAGCMMTSDGKVLLLKRHDAADEGGKWAFPGGMIEQGETPEMAAARETNEETGHTPDLMKELFAENNFMAYHSEVKHFEPRLNEEHTEFKWASFDDLPEPMHPGCAAIIQKYIKNIGNDATESARKEDMNGFITVNANPVSRSGVFQYLGKNLPDAEPNKMYGVLRPPEEIGSPEAIESFKLIPLVDDHTMLGPKKKGFTPAEQKGVHGVTGEDVYFKDGVLWAKLKIFSQTLYDMVQQGKQDLSLGYRCIYEKASGTFNGEPYEYIQRRLRGNHIALVDEGRCDVAVLDGADSYAFDSIDLTLQGDDKMANEPNLTEEQKKKDALDKKAKDEAEMKEKEEADRKAKDEAEKEKKDKEAADKKAKDEAEEKEKKEKEGMDARDKEIASLKSTVLDLQKNGLKTLMKEAAARDSLARELSPHVGVFDHSEMSLDEVAVYGAEKLGLKVAADQAQAAVGGYLAAAKGRVVNNSIAQDSKASADLGKLFNVSK